MFDWLFKKRSTEPKISEIAIQLPGRVFPWPKGVNLLAIDEIILAIPAAILHDDEQIGSVIFGHNEMEIKLPQVPANTPGACIYLRLRPGMSVSLTKSCDAMIVADDNTPRRLKVVEPPLKGDV